MHLKDDLDVDDVVDMNDTPLIWTFDLGSAECVVKPLDAGAHSNVYKYDG